MTAARSLPIYDPEAHGARCGVCPLKGRTVVPPARAEGAPRFIVVGEGPGRREVFLGVPFVGQSGALLDTLMAESGLQRQDAHVTNSFLCPAHDGEDKLKEQAVECCSERLVREIDGLREETGAKLPILPLGAFALRATLGLRAIMRARGFVWTTPTIEEPKLRSAERAIEKRKEKKLSREKTEAAERKLWLLRARHRISGHPLLATLHPAFILRGADGWMPVVLQDFRRFAALLTGQLQLEDERAYATYRVVRAEEELRAALKKFGETVIIDVETDDVDPLTTGLECVGLSDVDMKTGRVKNTIVAYPWRKRYGRILNAFFRKRIAVTHNGPQFDHLVMERHGCNFPHWEDTLVATQSFASHLPKSLAHVVSVYVSSGPWKLLSGKIAGAEEKGQAPWERGGDDLTQYNAADVRLTALVWRRMAPDLRKERAIYDVDRRLAIMCKRMRQTGMAVDMERRLAVAAHLKGRKAALLGIMRRMVGDKTFTPTKLDHVREALFTRFDAPMLRPTASGKPSTNNETLETLKDSTSAAAEFADLLLRWRSCGKALSTFINSVQVGADGRIHPGWKLGPVTGRLACSGRPVGNVMNLPRLELTDRARKLMKRGLKPHEVEARIGREEMYDPTTRIRELYVAPKGRKFVYFDLPQSEMRASAAVSGDPKLLAACEGDVHANNAKVIFQYDPVASEALAKDPKGLGKEYRDVAKNCGFAICYRGSAERVFITLTRLGFRVSMEACEALVDVLHETYIRYYEYIDENVAHVRKHGWLRGELSGRRRYFGQFGKETEIANYPIQEFIASLMNVRLPRIEDRLADLPGGGVLIGQFHDAAVVEVDEGAVDDIRGMIVDVWKEPIYVKRSGVTFVMPVGPGDVKVGDRLSDF